MADKITDFRRKSSSKKLLAKVGRIIPLAAFFGLTGAVPVAQTAASPLQSNRLLSYGTEVREISLDGDWQMGLNRRYDRVVCVPGLATDPTQPTAETLWVKRALKIPDGHWTQATLTLKGARFAPTVYLNGNQVSAAEGGMAATFHRFALPTGAAGQTATMEIALQSLKDLNPKDASAVPGADLWRNNTSSYLWDSVVLRLHGAGEISRVIPASDLKTDSVAVKWELGSAAPGAALNFQILDERSKILVKSENQAVNTISGTTRLALRHKVASWSPENPHLYRLRTELRSGKTVIDAREQSFGQRDFHIEGLGFRLNGQPYPIRMGTVVWHRWTRDPEAKNIAFDPVWFENNVVRRLKSMGANALRFHLGLPPEKFLDLCDRNGLAVQLEWPFFHGINASKESMETQWRAWLDTAMRHPSVVIVHPWNETGGEQLKLARSALDPLLLEYPPLVVSHINLTPIHKYWWSLFENLGLYYDSATQFSQAVMTDEFGGNYLDGEGNPGGYPTTRETFLRFLGRNNTRDERLQLQADANARVAEYWRRLGVAGFSPFCILGSPQDGNHWFLGRTDIAAPTPKPVWAALSAAFAPRSVSLEIWNRNFLPGETVPIPLYFFNDGDTDQKMSASVHVVAQNTAQEAMHPLRFQAEVKAHRTKIVQIAVPLPSRVGEWRLEARLNQPRPSNPVVSAWQIRTFTPHPAASLQNASIGVPEEETELRAMLSQMNLRVVAPSDVGAQILLGSRSTWQKLRDDAAFRGVFDNQLHSGKSVVLLDAGPQPLGVGYQAGNGLGGPLEGAPTVSNPAVLQESALFGGVKVAFREVAEPESTVHPAAENAQLWQSVPWPATRLWNGLRGGLIVPAADMQVSGLSGKAVLSVWQARGADSELIADGHYFAYELAGYYAFASRADDKSVSDALRQRVKFLVEDAPALQGVVNPDAPIIVSDLGALYAQSQADGEAQSLAPLVNAGKNLSRTPVVKISFGAGAGNLVLSQLLTAGRLLPGHSEPSPGVYGLRHDPVAVQFVLNMLSASFKTP